jgi:hypothetical protein
MIANPKGKTKADGFKKILGMDSGDTPDEIEPGYHSFLINTRCRGGYTFPRPGYNKIELTFSGDANLSYRFKKGRFQGAQFFDPESGESCLVVSIGGRLFRINVDSDNSVQEITITHATAIQAAFLIPEVGFNVTITVADTTNIGLNYTVVIGGKQFVVQQVLSGTSLVIKNVDGVVGDVVAIGTLLNYWEVNPASRIKAWLCQAEKWLVVQDGQSTALIYNGATTRRADSTEIRPGRAMAYGMGRLWSTGVDGRSFSAGDLVFGPSGTPQHNFKDAVLKVTENDLLAGGGYFTTPSNSGGIKAFRFIANLDTSQGQGPLMVCTPNQIFSVNAPFDRTQWQTMRNPIQTITAISHGALGHENTVMVNGDMFFRAKDGIRSYILARREFGQWSQTPQSREMNRVLEKDDQWLLEYGSSVVFDNRLLTTCSPVFSDHGIYHRGIVALDLDPLGGIRKKKDPSYDGLWNGLNTLQLVVGDFSKGERCFAFHLNNAQEIELYEITKDDKFDNEVTPINWTIETRSLVFGSDFELKQLKGGDLWIDRLTGRVDFNLLFRPDQHPCWQNWHSWSECANYKDCATTDPLTGCQTLTTFREQFRPRMPLPQPPDIADNLTMRPFRNGYEFQMRLELQGFCRIKRGRFMAHQLEELSYEGET